MLKDLESQIKNSDNIHLEQITEFLLMLSANLLICA